MSPLSLSPLSLPLLNNTQVDIWNKIHQMSGEYHRISIPGVVGGVLLPQKQMLSMPLHCPLLQSVVWTDMTMHSDE
jgi:hypothetical protein